MGLLGEQTTITGFRDHDGKWKVELAQPGTVRVLRADQAFEMGHLLLRAASTAYDDSVCPACEHRRTDANHRILCESWDPQLVEG